MSAVPASPAFTELTVPGSWQIVDFISDLHLQANLQATFLAWQQYMQNSPADAVCILGDLFEVWVGDDAAASSFEAQCVRVLQERSKSSAVFCMVGNRDFLLGDAFMRLTGVQALADPTVLSFNNTRYLLTHGDALCLDDHAYQDFRRQVRSSEWQTAFLAKPLAERQNIANKLRLQSQAAQLARLEDGSDYFDVSEPEACKWLVQANAHCMVHGHTHRPLDHALACSNGHATRVVLSDWDAQATPPRLQVLRLTKKGLKRLEAK